MEAGASRLLPLEFVHADAPVGPLDTGDVPFSVVALHKPVIIGNPLVIALACFEDLSVGTKEVIARGLVDVNKLVRLSRDFYDWRA
jgi:hypothetical protein